MFTAASTFIIFALTSVKVFAANLPPNTLPYSLSSINNCSGDVPPLPVGVNEYFSGYGPQILGHEGWETWTYEVPGIVNDSLSVFTWTRGDPASKSSDPEGLATFSVFASHVGFSASVKDKFVYQQVGNFLAISIGDNHLTFNGSNAAFGTWNVSVNIDGLELNLSTVAVPPDLPFTPKYDGVPSQLVDGYFTNIAVTRGHTDGPFKYPSGEIWQVHDVSSLRHTYAKKPIQDLVASYVRGTSYIVLTALHWFQAESIYHEKVEAAQLCVGLTDTDIPVTYQATNDPSIFTISTTELNTTVTFPSCNATQGYPFILAGYPISYRGSFVDSAGGTTEYYSTQTDASLWTAGQLYVGNNSLGMLEIYTPPEN